MRNSPLLLLVLVFSKASMIHLGNLEYFLGIEVKRLTNGSLLLSQSKYVQDFLNRVGMANAKGISTPLPSGLKFSKLKSDYMDDPSLYRSIVGALQYITITRPEIGYSVNKACQFMAQPLMDHWKVVKHILRYLKGSIAYVLHIQPISNVQNNYTIHAYCDADWASDIDDKHSTSGACIYFGSTLVSWWSKRYTLVARLSVEVEYRSLATTAIEIVWLQSLLHELYLKCNTLVIYCDNQSVVALSHNHVLHSRTKHMELDIFFVREKVLQQSLIVRHIPVVDQIADILTKPLSQA